MNGQNRQINKHNHKGGSAVYTAAAVPLDYNSMAVQSQGGITMTQYKEYYIDYVYFFSKADIDSFLKRKAIGLKRLS